MLFIVFIDIEFESKQKNQLIPTGEKEVRLTQRHAVQPSQSLILIEEIETPKNAPSHLWWDVSSLFYDSQSNVLAVFNIKPPRVSLLNARTLELIATWGTKGRGPGEFQEWFTWIGIRNNTVFVSQTHRTARFSFEGKYLDSDIRTLNRTIRAGIKIDRANGVDEKGNVYYWDGRPTSEFLVAKVSQGDIEEYLIRRGDFDHLPFRFWNPRSEKMDIDLGVLADGSLIMNFAHEPVVIRYTKDGMLKWSVDLLKELPFLKPNYESVKAAEFYYPATKFWVDETYTILTFTNRRQEIGEPNIYYVFLNSNNGSVVKVSYAAENVIREIVRRQPSEHNKLYRHDLYNPFAITHANGILFTFAYNSSRIQKYKLTWHD